MSLKMETHGFAELTEGLRELERQLVALGANEGRKVLQAAARKAFKPVLDAAVAKVPRDSGLTADNLVLTAQKPESGSDAVVAVGLRVRKAKENRKSRHGYKGAPKEATSPHWRWHFIEGGTATQPARPFLRPALDQNAEGVLSAFRDELGKAIDRAVKRQARAAKRGTPKKKGGGK